MAQIPTRPYFYDHGTMRMNTKTIVISAIATVASRL
jgi:hypothetical protein